MKSRGRLRNAIFSRWWLWVEVVTAIGLIAGATYLPQGVFRPGLDIMSFYQLLGGDALTLMGFLIQALAIVGALIDRRILDQIRGQPAFSDLWQVFVLTAFTLGIQTVVTRLLGVFILPDYLFLIVTFLAIMNVFLIADCILLFSLSH